LGLNIFNCVRYSAQSFRDLANSQICTNFISWAHREQDAPDNKKKRQQRTCRFDRSQTKASNM